MESLQNLVERTEKENLKNIYLSQEFRYIKNRLKVNKIIDGHWNDGRKLRPLTIDEKYAYKIMQEKKLV